MIFFCKGSKCVEDDVDGKGVENLRLKKLEIPEKDRIYKNTVRVVTKSMRCKKTRYQKVMNGKLFVPHLGCSLRE